MTKENMAIWDKVSKTDPKNTKLVTLGKRKFNTIDAYSQIKKATELWGPYGMNWGLKDISFDFSLNGSHLATIKAIFFINTGEVQIEFPAINAIQFAKANKYSEGQLKIDDDFAKKLETDTITKALSRLGFNADIFMGEFDDNKYSQEAKIENDESVKYFTDFLVRNQCPDVEKSMLLDSFKMKGIDARRALYLGIKEEKGWS